MNNLGLYIREALGDKDEIYLLGIGTFKKERVPAYFDELKKKFMPPSQTITLKAEQVSDANFIDFLAEKEHIDLNAAQLKVAEAVNDIEEKEEVFLEGLGELKNNNGVFEFTYTENTEARFSEFEPISEGEVLKPIEKLVEEITETPLVEDNNLEYAEQEVSSKRWLWPVIGTAACVVIAAIWFLNPIANNNKTEIVKNQNTNGAESIEQTAVQTPAIETSISDSIALATIEPELTDVESTSSLVREQGRFEIIIAAFKTIQEAEEYVQLTNSKGYQVHILKNNRANNLNKISYASYQNEKEAEIALAKVRKELNAEAWLWENKRSNINN